MRYLQLIGEYVFARTLMRTDIFSAVVGALMPAAFYLLGKPMPSDIAVTISLWIGASVAVVLLGRLLAAPYVLWRRDQGKITALEETVADPNRRRRLFFEEQFLSKRASLADQLSHYVPLNLVWEHFHKIDIDAELRPVTANAVIFLGDQAFKMYWTNFCAGLRLSHAATRFLVENGEALEQKQADTIADRAAFDFEVMTVSALALVSMLTENYDHAAQYEADLERINDKFPGVDKTSPPSDLWVLPSFQSLPDIATEMPR